MTLFVSQAVYDALVKRAATSEAAAEWLKVVAVYRPLKPLANADSPG